MRTGDLSRAEDLLVDPRLPEDLGRLKAEKRFWTQSVCLALFRRADLIGFERPEEGLELARQAARLVDRLPGTYRAGSAKMLFKSRSFVILGSRLRALARLGESDLAYDGAISLARGASPFDVADLQRRWAYLRTDQRRFQEGEALANHALGSYRQERAPDYLIGRALVCRGDVYFQAEAYELAIRDYRRGAELIDPEQCFVSYYCAVHNLASASVKTAGSREEIEAALRQIGRVKAIGFEAETMPGLVMKWLEGLLLEKLGREPEAESAFRSAIRGFVEVEAPYETALAMLDLSTLLCRQGRHKELIDVAARMFPLFGSFRANREVFAGLRMFHHAAVQQRVTAALIADVRQQIEKAARQVD